MIILLFFIKKILNDTFPAPMETLMDSKLMPVMMP